MSQQPRVTAYFNRQPERYAAQYGKQTAAGYAFRVRRESLLRLLGPGPGRVLDIGCGPGVMTDEIVKQGWSYEGIDLAPEMIAVAQKHFANRTEINFQVGAVTQIPALDQFFDAVVAMGLMEYLDDEAAALAEIRRVLKPAGRLIVSIPNWWSPARMWDRWLLTPLARFYRFLTGRGPSSKLSHREYRLGRYLKFLEQNGFEAIKWQATNYRVLPRPFDFWFPELAIATARWSEKYLARIWCLGTSVNVMAKQKSLGDSARRE